MPETKELKDLQEPKKQPKESKAKPDAKPDAAAGEQSGSYVYPADGGAAGSQRLRLVPPDGKPTQWWQRHKEKFFLAELALTGVFFAGALYFLYLWLFG